MHCMTGVLPHSCIVRNSVSLAGLGLAEVICGSWCIPRLRGNGQSVCTGRFRGLDQLEMGAMVIFDFGYVKRFVLARDQLSWRQLAQR